MRDFVYLHPNNLMRSALQPTWQSCPKQSETNATNCRTARCNLIILTMQNKEIHTSGAHKRPQQPKVSGKFLLLDTRLLNSPDLFRLRETMGMEGWGMALFVLNYLLEHGEWGRAPLHAVTDLARMCHKNKRSMMALLTDYPTLFEIEAGGKVFNSPYLRQCLGGEKIKINQKSCGLETLTNEPSDNQALSLHRIKDERIKKKNDEEKETTAADAADAVAKKAEKGTKQPAASGTEEVEVVARPVVKGAEQRVTSGTEEAEVVGRSVASGAKQRVTSGTEEVKMVGRPVVKGAEQRVASAAKASPATNALPDPLTEVAPSRPPKLRKRALNTWSKRQHRLPTVPRKLQMCPPKLWERALSTWSKRQLRPPTVPRKLRMHPQKLRKRTLNTWSKRQHRPPTVPRKLRMGPQKLRKGGTNAWGKLQNSLDFGWKRCSPTLHKPPANCPMMSGNRCAPRGKFSPNSTPTASIGKASNAWWGSKSTAKNAGSA